MSYEFESYPESKSTEESTEEKTPELNEIFLPLQAQIIEEYCQKESESGKSKAEREIEWVKKYSQNCRAAFNEVVEENNIVNMYKGDPQEVLNLIKRKMKENEPPSQEAA